MYDLLNAYLENGLKVVVHRAAQTKTIACGLWVGQGSTHETDENNGLSHLLEHLLINPDNENNLKYRQLMKQVAAEGVIYNAATTKDYTCFHFTGLRNTLEKCISCLAGIAKENREFSDDFFENEKSVVLQEATTFYSSFQQIKERTSQAIWGNTGTGKIIMGNMQNVAQATQEKVERILTDAYVPENSMIVVSGDIQYEEVLSIVERYFGNWKDERKCVGEEIVESTPGVYFNRGNGVSTVVSIGFRAPSYRSQARLPLEMMTRILGMSNMDSRLVKEVRMKRGLSYNLGGFSSFYGKRGTIGLMAVCDKEKALEVAKVMIDVINEAKIKGFSEEEIEREKRIMETSMLLSVENITEHLRNIGKCSMMDSNFYIENEIRMIRNIRKSDVEKETKELIQENGVGLAIIGDCNLDEMLDAIRIA